MKKALIVGLNNYPRCKLNCCNNDVTSISGLFEANGDGSPNFEVITITDECTKEKLKQSIELLFADDDIALLYFSDMVQIRKEVIFVQQIRILQMN